MFRNVYVSPEGLQYTGMPVESRADADHMAKTMFKGMRRIALLCVKPKVKARG